MNIIELNAATQVAGIVKKPIKDALLRLKGDTEIALAFDAYKQNGTYHIKVVLFNNSDKMEYNMGILSEKGNKLCNDFFLPSKHLIEVEILQAIALVHGICGASSLDRKESFSTTTVIYLVIDDKQYVIDVDIKDICRFAH